MELVQYEKFYNDAMQGMDDLFEDRKDSMKNFNKKNYPDIFERLTKKYSKVFLCVEEIYAYEEDKERWLNKLAERFVNHAVELIGSQRWKFQKNNTSIDCNMFVVTYVLPLILKYDGKSSQPFADAIVNQWNATFDTNMECGDYDKIYGGFRTTILGINFER